MEPQDPHIFVRLDLEIDEFGVQRAFVSIQPTLRDGEVWDAMDQSALGVAKVFGRGRRYWATSAMGWGRPTTKRGPCGWGTILGRSVTDGEGRFHGVEKAYAVGPALFPTIGSPNPILTGSPIGLAPVRR